MDIKLLNAIVSAFVYVFGLTAALFTQNVVAAILVIPLGIQFFIANHYLREYEKEQKSINIYGDKK